MYESILVPVDGSDHSQKALAIACQLAAPSRAVIYILNAPEMPPATDPLGIAVGAPGMEISTEAMNQAGQEVIKQVQAAEEAGRGLLDRFAENTAGSADYEIKPVVRVGTPSRVIVEEAANLKVDVIVMGSRGMSNLKSLIIGSTSHKVMHTAGCTVITVHCNKPK